LNWNESAGRDALHGSTHTAASTQVKDVMRTDKRYSIRSVLLLADC